MEHVHKWRCFGTDKLICDCNTVTSIKDLLANTETDTAKQTKIDILSKQLFAGELKKAAHEEAYVWVRRNSAGALDPMTAQGMLL